MLRSKYAELFLKIQILFSILFGFSILFILRYQYYLLGYQEFGDECETIVVAKMMAAGNTLYSESFNQHGALTFLPGFILELIGNFRVPHHRAFIFLLQWIALLSLYFSPIYKKRWHRQVSFMGAATFMMAFLPEINGHTYVYQTMAGLFTMIVITQHTLPAVLGIQQNKWIIFICTMLTIGLPFLALTYLPPTFLLLLAGTRKTNLKNSIAGIFTASIIIFAYLMAFASLKGYYAYHYYLNSHIYFAGRSVFDLLFDIINFAFNNWLGFITMIFLLMIAAKLNRISNEKYPWRGIILVSVVMSFWLRGTGWFIHGIPYWYAMLGLIPVFFLNWSEKEENIAGVDQDKNIHNLMKTIPIIILSCICVAKLSLFLPGEMNRILTNRVREDTEFARIARTITTKEDKILAFTFQTQEYILANRLPASIHFYYFAFQAAYNKQPVLGMNVKLKDDIIKNRPKIILVDRWPLWNLEMYAWMKYAADVQDVIDKGYNKIENTDIYIRKDIKLSDFGLNYKTVEIQSAK
jgi:hypothetical protein